MIFNIIQNAIKYNRPGGKIDILQRVLQKDGEAHLETKICDQGEGISSDRIKALFNIFGELKEK